MLIVNKITGTQQTADEFNQIPDEIENAITSSGQAPSAGDINQLEKAISIYAADADFYTDSGVANAYTLSTIGSRVAPPSYTTGMRVRFVAGNTNTSGSTINVDSIGVQNITDFDGNALTAGQIISGQIIILFFDGSNFVLKEAINYSNAEVITGTGTANLSQETFVNPSSDFTLTLEPASVANGLTKTIKHIGSANIVTVDADGSETIGGDLTKNLGPFGKLVIKSNGTNWEVIDYDSGNIDFLPVYTGSVAMTFTSVTTNIAQFRIINDFVHINILAIGTTGGVANSDLRASIPTEIIPATTQRAAGFTADGTVNDNIPSGINISLLDFKWRLPDSSNYGLGINRQVAGNFFYKLT